MRSYEVNIDTLVGPTHNYSGLSYGNVASVKNRFAVSNPRQAALQGLEKMKYLADLGIKHLVFPPQERPHLPTLRSLGFYGSDQEVISKAFKQNPDLFFACSSSSSMWTANAATVSPSADTQDGRVHFTPANLFTKFHRSIEPISTARVLRIAFPDPHHFVHHPFLFEGAAFSDEGAANQIRFCHPKGGAGVELLVYGSSALENEPLPEPKLFPARQTFEASQAIARIHQLLPEQIVFVQQNPDAIDAGVFHNDVISMGHQNLFLYHECAFQNSELFLKELKEKIEKTCRIPLIPICVPNDQISLRDAVASYLFNSQIVSLPDDSMHLLAPIECWEIPSVRKYLEELIQSKQTPIVSMHYINLKESMRNGGGPACLRLRVVLNQQELDAVYEPLLLTPKLYQELKNWIALHYRERLELSDLADPNFFEENKLALDKLAEILQLK